MSSKGSKADRIRPIEHLNGVQPASPEWFSWAVSAPSEESYVEVAGAKIHYSAWGKRGAPGILFVHGGRAHRQWWRPFAPYFADRHRVASLDMSGMGDSDWRDRYEVDCIIDEMFAVIEGAGLNNGGGRPIVVGHSFGGWMTLAAVERSGEKLAGAVVIDSPISKPDPDEGYTIMRPSSDNPERPKYNRVYETIEEPITRFRFLPNQPCDTDFIVDFIAREGLTNHPPSGEQGWTWKFDPRHGQNAEIHFERDLFLAARCPLAFIYGEKSAFAQGEGFEAQQAALKGRAPFIVMPGVHHHLMMEEPIAFISTLKTLLATWPIRIGL
ncbi:MAG: alpha/beta hydrolase [Pseudomonadota bacterium]